jgi:TetR/AcrR family transcriptional regulator, tetracycline repressor protein
MARPRTVLIDRRVAVRTALEMIDEDGLASFSIEKLSKRLGVRGPSLYHHFDDRAELLARVATLVLSEVPDPWDGDEPAEEAWDEAVLRMTLEFRRAMLRHPNAGPVLLEYFPRDLVMAVYERVVTMLEAEGVPDRYHLLIFEGLEKLTLGSALYWSTVATTTKRRRGTPFGDVSSSRFPALKRAVKASTYGDEELFEASCRAFLEGIKLRVASEGAGR